MTDTNDFDKKINSLRCSIRHFDRSINVDMIKLESLEKNSSEYKEVESHLQHMRNMLAIKKDQLAETKQKKYL